LIKACIPLLPAKSQIVNNAAKEGVIASIPYTMKFKIPDWNMLKFFIKNTHINGSPNAKIKNEVIDLMIFSSFILTSSQLGTI
jgi:hypothetical protein